MLEQAKVIKTEGKNAIVRIDKKEQCSNCGLCLFPDNTSFIEIRVANNVNAKKQDVVQVEREGSGKFTGALLVFLVPLMLIGLACLISLTLIKKEIWILFLSLIFIFLWYTILAIIDKKLSKIGKFGGCIVKILQEGGEKDIGDN